MVQLHFTCTVWNRKYGFFEWQSRYLAYNAAAYADMGWLPHLGQFCYLDQFWSMICVTWGYCVLWTGCHIWASYIIQQFVILTHLDQFVNVTHLGGLSFWLVCTSLTIWVISIDHFVIWLIYTCLPIWLIGLLRHSFVPIYSF